MTEYDDAERQRLKAQFIDNQKEHYGRVPTVLELDEFDAKYRGWVDKGRKGSILGAKSVPFTKQDEKNLTTMEKLFAPSSKHVPKPKKPKNTEIPKTKHTPVPKPKKQRTTFGGVPTRKERIAAGTRRLLRGGGERVYVHRDTGEIYIPRFAKRQQIKDFNTKNWREVYGIERKKKIEQKITQEKFEKEKAPTMVQKQKRWFGRRKEGAIAKGSTVKKKGIAWFGRRKEGAYAKGGKVKAKSKWAWKHKGAALEKGVRTSTEASIRMRQAGTRMGYALPAPFQIFTLAWEKASKVMKILIILVFFLCIFFIPWGIFYYAGWAVAAAVMFLLSLIYWIFITLFNGIASLIVSLINGAVRMIMSAVIMVVEVVLDALTEGTNVAATWERKVPEPLWASRYTGTYNGTQMDVFEAATAAGRNVTVPNHYWWDGHVILEGSLINFSQIANVPALMTVVAPQWQSWMYDTLIVKMIQFIPGLKGLTDGWLSVNRGIVGAFEHFVDTAPGYQVLIVGLIPIIIIISLVLIVYFKNRHYLYG